MSASGLHISIAAEPVTSIGGFVVTNSMFTSVIVSALLICLAVAVRMSLKDTDRPRGLQNFAEFIIGGLENMVKDVTGQKIKTRLFFPFVATFFLVILVSNWTGLLPGFGTIGYLHYPSGETEHAALLEQDMSFGSQVMAAEEIHQTEVVTDEELVAEHAESIEPKGTFVPYLRPGTADLNGTLALGLLSVGLTQFFGLRFLKLNYLKKFINFSNPIMFFVGLLELISEFAKIISFAFRLFGNIFAGEVLLVVITGLTMVIVPMPFYGLEIFVGFIQALVFAMLSVVFFNMATIGHEDH